MTVGASVEYLIVGQGLAGTALAWELIWRGREVLVVDTGEAVTSSRIAAGLVTPITGQRLALSWRVAEMLAAARAFYARMENGIGGAFFRDLAIRRLFQNEAEAARWQQRRTDPAFQAHAAQAWLPEAGPFGGMELRGAQLSCARYLEASRAALARRGCFEQRVMEPREVADFPARKVIFCQGFAAAKNPFFSWIEWKAAKGEILTVKTTGLDPGKAVTAGQWLAPEMMADPAVDLADADAVENGGTGWQFARTGSTYEWTALDQTPTEEARAKLVAGLSRLHGQRCEVIAHHAAVRPIIRESKALIGLHPAREKLGFFNGLGSKGSLHAPFFARQFARHLAEGQPLEPECDLQRNG